MAKEMLKIGDLVEWGVPGVDKTPIHAMVIEYYDGRWTDGEVYWIAMRGDGSRWTINRCTSPDRTGYCKNSNRGSWWSMNRLGPDFSPWNGVRTGGILV